ncbi:copper-translocating P-type ATPase [Geomonas silvestris]|uniref:Copper-translocating P-type ATPase n=1 Tax=Geomonas silvestris TaxID=2740184 RepID=A0A6V8MEB1_9BACT|nr:heavy metal translocating P-type ATPase [Geomonas silvestris]GFO58320.1 copper-translocating P-type ATPase [Geomonas silvestris]
MTDPGTCFHCGSPILPGQLVTETGSGTTLSFCCRGCHGAYLLINGAGLAEFYRRRDWQESGVAASDFQSNLSAAYLARFVRQQAVGATVDIIIEGIRCASCVWLNEKILTGLEGVLEARVNYATGRARVRFAPERIDAGTIFSRIAQLGYRPRPYTASAAQEAAQQEQRDLLIRFGTAVFLTMQLMAYAFGLYAGYFQGIGAGMKNLLQLFSLAVTTPVIFYCGWPFFSGAWRALKNRAANMEVLIALGALASYGYSAYASFTGGEVYFETAAMIVTLILAGRLLENAAKRRASSSIELLLGLSAGEARRLTGDTLETVEAAALEVGDRIVVGAGERFPTDGRVESGMSEVDQSPATGESLPVAKGPGDPVIAGSSNLTGTLTVRCEKVAAESFIARMAHLVEEAQSRRAPIQGVADRVSALFVPLVLLAALGTLFWQAAQGLTWESALLNALAVLLIACPCALGLATPTAILAGTGAAAAAGILFRGGDILERLSRVDHAVFDKTGTLTQGVPELATIEAEPGCDPARLIALAAALEAGSRHPVGLAICAEAARRGLVVPRAERLLTVAGGGVTGRLDGERLLVGSARFLAENGVRELPRDRVYPSGALVVHLSCGERLLGTLLFKDRLREDAAEVVRYFSEQQIEGWLLSGDRQEAARQVAQAVGLTRAFGELAPAQKAERLEELRRQGGVVLMVGDGINDAPALGTADVGCAVAGGTDIAIETSDLVLVKPELGRLVLAHRLARRTMAVVRQNLAWAFLYNLIGVPLAMAGRLTPIYAACAMALSSLCVVGNSLRLLRRNDG